MEELTRVLFEHLRFIYGDEEANVLLPRVNAIIESNESSITPKEQNMERYTEKDSILIIYGDNVREDGVDPLASLSSFLTEWVSNTISTVHILPFFPYSSDDGFSVIDYKKVNRELGTWEDIERLNQSFRLMFDIVINHISASSEWFKRFVSGENKYQDYFISVDPNEDLSQVFRPRALPLVSSFDTDHGKKHVWTTFSQDQIDLNFSNPDVLFEIIDILLFYVSKGADFFRLDAIAFIWKEIGTSSIHLPQTHRIVQLLRTVLDLAAPWVTLITETNVSHEENLSYFGDGSNESQMVYNFSLSPLVLNAFHTGNAEVLTKWAASLSLPSEEVTFINFLASHDGIGLLPAKGILSEDAIDAMVQRVHQLDGNVSFRKNPDGSQSAYELNINYLDALGDPAAKDEDVEIIARRFLVSQAIMLSIRGVPGIYFHSLFGSRNWLEGVEISGQARRINREKLQRESLEQELSDKSSLRHHVFSGYKHLLNQRQSLSAFRPNGQQKILDLDYRLFVVHRYNKINSDTILCLHNVSGQEFDLSIGMTDNFPVTYTRVEDTLTDLQISIDNGFLNLQFHPYEFYWLRLI